ncbi:hypothetical protein MJD09_27845, partial [bacterium]|nr:hypothetical protein [bacterium]
MIRPLFVILLLQLLLGCVRHSYAQIETRKFGIGVLAGASRLQGDLQPTSTALTSGLLLRFSPFSFFAISGYATYGTVGSGLNSIKTRMFNASLTGTVFLLPNSRLRPFVSGGWSRFHYDVRNQQGEQVLNSQGSPLGSWQQAFQFGGGLELSIGRNWAINTLADYLVAPVDDLDAIVEGSKDGFMRGLFGVVYYFGGGKKKDSSANSKRWQRKLGVSLEQARRDKAADSKQNASETLNKSELFSDGIFFEPGGTAIQ